MPRIGFFQIQSEIQTLENLPFRCPLAPENDVFDQEIRQLIIGKKECFLPSNLLIFIFLHFRHGSQLWLSPDMKEIT